MNPQDLKQGQSYLILAKFDEKDFYNEYDFVAAPSDYRLVLDEASVRQCVFLPSEPPTLVGSPSKYSPIRRFRKGDRVRVVAWQGRVPSCPALLGKIANAVSDEHYADVRIQIDSGEGFCTIYSCFLELITPIEELEPYEVTESTDYFAVENRSKGDEVATFWKEGHPNPKEAAEAECARLNAEFRKEQK